MLRSVHRRAAACIVLICLAAACTSTDSGPRRATQQTAAPSSATATATEPPVRPEDVKVDAALAGLDRRQQVAQLFVVGVPLDDIGAGDTLVAEARVGGVFLQGRSRAAAGELAATHRAVGLDRPGATAVGGRGPGGRPGPGAVAAPDFRRSRRPSSRAGCPRTSWPAWRTSWGRHCAAAGVNLDLAPVMDVVPPGTEAGNAPIGAHGRQYAGAADEVLDAAAVIVTGLAAHGVTATLKHFPGLGRVRDNTDTTADVVDDVTTRYDGQVAAFGTLARSPAHPFVMMSSATYAAIDPTAAAAFSPVVIGELLRGQLVFDGVVISDDLGAARAVADVEVGERAVRFLAAGGTLVLTVDATTLPRMIEAVLARDAADPAFAAVIDGAVRTALLAKVRAGLLPG